MTTLPYRFLTLPYSYHAGGHVWLISQAPIGWHYQSDEITGDGDPGWMHGTAESAIDARVAIDATVAENSCTGCGELVGENNLTEMAARDTYLCRPCLWAEAERQRDLREAADDDKAHALRDRI